MSNHVVNGVKTEISCGNNAYDLETWSTKRFKGEPEPMKYLVQDLIPLGITGTFYSPGGIGKSTLALDLAVRVTLSEKFQVQWLGHFPVCTFGKVIYISGEEPDAVLHLRLLEIIKVLSEQLNKPQEEIRSLVDENLYLANLWGSAKSLFNVNKINLEPSEEYEKIYNTINEGSKSCGVRLVILDTRSRFSGAEGAGNNLVSREVSFYERLAKDFNATVLILHHTNKASQISEINSSIAFRGETGFIDAVRFAIHLKGLSAKEGSLCKVSEDERHNYLVITNTKQNYSEINPPLVIQRRGYHFENAGIHLHEARAEKKKIQEKEEIDYVCQIVRKEDGLNQSQIIERTRGKLSLHKTKFCLEKALKQNLITYSKGERGALLYNFVMQENSTRSELRTL